MNLGAFTVAIFVKNKTNGDEIQDWIGFGKSNPLIAAFMVISLVSLAGLPPTSGFVAKFYILAELFRLESHRWLAIVAVINSVISLYYYFRIIKSMYFIESEETKSFIEDSQSDTINKFIIIVLSIQPIIFYIYWSPLLAFIKSSLSMWSS